MYRTWNLNFHLKRANKLTWELNKPHLPGGDFYVSALTWKLIKPNQNLLKKQLLASWEVYFFAGNQSDSYKQ